MDTYDSSGRESNSLGETYGTKLGARGFYADAFLRLFFSRAFAAAGLLGALPALAAAGLLGALRALAAAGLLGALALPGLLRALPAGLLRGLLAEALAATGELNWALKNPMLALVALAAAGLLLALTPAGFLLVILLC